MTKLRIILACLGCLSSIAFANTTEMQVVKDTFAWFNQISSTERQPFTQKDIAQHFTKDAKMITNNKLACEGIAGHFDHFVELNQHYKIMKVDINSIDMRQAGDRVYLDYAIDSVDDKQQNTKIHVMGYMEVQNNRIKLFKEIVSFEGDKKAVVG
ncbi:MAG: hypothetical protein HYX61_10540 [Gammaproteobacteria bacterium]|nr:hypothetical protein [Gammaproteobacteria bacterium]